MQLRTLENATGWRTVQELDKRFGTEGNRGRWKKRRRGNDIYIICPEFNFGHILQNYTLSSLALAAVQDGIK